MTKEFSWRYMTLGLLFTALAAFIVLQMVRIQISPQAKFFRDRGNAISGYWKTFYPARGPIYDRAGHLLAGNKTVYEVGVDLTYPARNPSTIAMAVNAVIGLDYDTVFTLANQASSDNALYRMIADFVTEEEKVRLEQLRDEMEIAYAESDDIDRPNLDGLVFKPHLQRSYPDGKLAANLIGFVNREGRGFFGVEEQFDDLLAGDPQTIWVPADPNRVAEFPDIPQGASLVLTIDRTIQSKMEQILDDALNDTGAESGTIAIMDPKTGEIISMATTPRIDLNEYWRYGEVFVDPLMTYNNAISKSYESGSVYKVLTMASALDNNTVEPDTMFLDTGALEIGGTVIHNWNGGAWGYQDMVGCMKYSLNVCLAWIASELGTGAFYEYMQAFGIGSLTGIELAGEVPGRLKLPGDNDWYEAELGTNAFGQGVSVTPVQMLMAVSALANEGKMMTPRILFSMKKDGREYRTQPQIAGIPVSAETAKMISDMLAITVEVESYSNAVVDGYRIAGKTGTGEIPTPFGYTSNVTNASFVGWGPVDDPQFLVYVWLEKPQTSIWGSEVAAPVFREVVENLVILMNIPPDDVRMQLLNSN
jgi:cell division protein FtsI/penicillin-binding protein 2